MTKKQRKKMRSVVAKLSFAHKGERKAFKRAYKKELMRNETHISEALKPVVDGYSERYENTRGGRTRFTSDYLPVEMEYGVSHMTYKGKRCTRSKQYKYEGVKS